MIYSWMLENFGYPLFQAVYKQRNVIGILRELRKTQWLSESEIKDQQWQLLKSLLRQGYDHVPFYRKRFSQLGLTPDDIQNWDDFAKLPPLTKNDIRQNFDSLIADNVEKSRLMPGRSGGSTGKPTHFYRTIVSGDYVTAATFRNAEWAKWRLGSKYVNISGSHYDHSRFKQFRAKLLASYIRRKDFTAINLSAEKARDYFSVIRRFKPIVLWGYASGVYALSKFAHNLGEDDITFDSIIVSSDILFDEQRKFIEETFRCNVFNLYGSREAHIAGECERRKGFHIAAESVYIEVVDEHNQPIIGKPGRILVTDLRNLGFPMIRYEIGDVATRTEKLCPCGRGLPLLESINGRIEDFIVTPSGGIVSPPAFTVPFSDVVNIDDYQIIQNKIDSVDVLLVKTSKFIEDDFDHLKYALQDMLGKDMSINFKFVNAIDRGVSGKRRVVISSVKPDFL